MVNPKKLKIGNRSIPFLGYEIVDGKLMIDEEKIRLVKTLQRPKKQETAHVSDWLFLVFESTYSEFVHSDKAMDKSSHAL